MPTDSEKPISNAGSWVSRQDTGIYKILSEIYQERFQYSSILIKLLAGRKLFSIENFVTTENFCVIENPGTKENLGAKENFGTIEKPDIEKIVDVFLHSPIKNLHDPEHDPKLLPNIIPAVERLKQALISHEKVLVFGDYDADGVVSTALMYNLLKKIGANVNYHIPSRFEDGYDINIDYIKNVNLKKSYSLIICVDCGTNADEVREYVNCSKENNVDVIVCDHHEAVFTESSETLYIRYFIINPKLSNSGYSFKFLSGAGVTFKFIMEMLRNLDEQVKAKIPKDYLNSLLDLVAISTVADLMPLIDENRIIVKEGLKRIKTTDNEGLKRLVDKIIGDKDKFNTYDIGYIISPHLNASGRIKDAKSSIKLLLDREEGKEKVIFDTEISSIIKGLEKSNLERKVIQQETLNEILKNNDFSRIVSDEKIFIAKSENWSEGVLGIVSSEIVKKFNIPVILFKEANGILKGSGRSIEKFDLYDNLCSLSGYFKKFGGHKQACGITMEISNFEDFKSSIIKQANEKLKPLDIEKIYYFDTEISFPEINLELIEDISRLEPFGIGNPKPVFLTKDCSIAGEPRLLKDNKHMIIKLNNGGKTLEAIIFNCGDLCADFTNCIINNLKDKNPVNLLPLDILYNIEFKKNPYNDNKQIQLCIQSLKIITPCR